MASLSLKKQVFVPTEKPELRLVPMPVFPKKATVIPEVEIDIRNYVNGVEWARQILADYRLSESQKQK